MICEGACMHICAHLFRTTHPESNPWDVNKLALAEALQRMFDNQTATNQALQTQICCRASLSDLLSGKTLPGHDMSKCAACHSLSRLGMLDSCLVQVWMWTISANEGDSTGLWLKQTLFREVFTHSLVKSISHGQTCIRGSAVNLGPDRQQLTYSQHYTAPSCSARDYWLIDRQRSWIL